MKLAAVSQAPEVLVTCTSALPFLSHCQEFVQKVLLSRGHLHIRCWTAHAEVMKQFPEDH